ncbi:MAG: penicillin-binding protein 1A [Rubricoccaceae bacterium]
MDDKTYSDEELSRFFRSPGERRAARPSAPPSSGPSPDAPPPRSDDELAAFFGVSSEARGRGTAPGADTRALSPADEELARFFGSPDVSGDGASSPAPPPPVARPSHRVALQRAAPPRPPAEPPAPPADPVKRLTYRVLAGTLGLIGIGATLAVAVLAWFSRDLPSLDQIENPRNLLATVVYTADNQELARYYAGENRTWVPLSDISPHVINALLATEDRQFYDHWGVHLRRTLQAPISVLQGRPQGGSTVTQQLARNLYREQVRFSQGDRSVVRKIKEILTAVRIERIYTKDEILEAYLNTVPFLYNAYGIESASQTYFNKPAKELAPEEAAVLVGMLAANTFFDPVRNPENSRQRRNVVLANMENQGYLTRAEFERLREQPIALEFRAYSHEDNLAPHFAEVLRLWFRDWCAANGYDPYSDGLVIRTTIDSRMQQLATEAVVEQMEGLQAVVDYEWSGRGSVGSPEAALRIMRTGNVQPFSMWWSRNRAIVDEYIRSTPRYQALVSAGATREAATAQLRQDAAFMDSLRADKTRLEAGLVAIEPATGAVKAWVGGRDYVLDKFDHVGQARRQAGSTFKLFAYAAAFDNGFSPQSTALDAPFSWGDWSPRNAGSYSGNITLANALKFSKNTVAARVTKHFGAREVKKYAEEMGIRSPVEEVRSIALGVSDVTLLEMTNAYAVVANYGVYNGPSREAGTPRTNDYPPHIIQAVSRIEDRYGNVIADFTPTGREVISPSSAYVLFDVMRGVVSGGGTAGWLNSRFPATRGLDLSGKTGTTQESGDGWFIVMHPDLVVGSWTGFNDRRITFRSMYWGQGGHTALLNVGAFLQKLQTEGGESVRLDPARRLAPPENYAPPARIGRIGGGSDGGSFAPGTTRRRAPGEAGGGSDEERPARDLIRRFQELDRARSGGGEAPAEQRPSSGGRIAW